MTKRRVSHCFMNVELAMWKQGIEDYLEVVARSLANELRSTIHNVSEPLIYYCHQHKVDGFEGGTMYCEEHNEVEESEHDSY